jgi:hypothetical protein
MWGFKLIGTSRPAPVRGGHELYAAMPALGAARPRHTRRFHQLGGAAERLGMNPRGVCPLRHSRAVPAPPGAARPCHPPASVRAQAPHQTVGRRRFFPSGYSLDTLVAMREGRSRTDSRRLKRVLHRRGNGASDRAVPIGGAHDRGNAGRFTSSVAGAPCSDCRQSLRLEAPCVSQAPPPTATAGRRGNWRHGCLLTVDSPRPWSRQCAQCANSRASPERCVCSTASACPHGLHAHGDAREWEHFGVRFTGSGMPKQHLSCLPRRHRV